MRRRLATAALLALAALLLFGCGDSDPSSPVVDPPVTYGPYATPQLLMDAFKTAYEERDSTHYDALLDEDFLFFFLEREERDFWGKADDLISTGNLMSGEARTNSQGQLTRAISRVDMDQMTLLEPWADVPAEHPQFGATAGAKFAIYKVRCVFVHPSGTITVDSNQRFYAVPETVDGEPSWALLGQGDMDGKANEDYSWSSVKALFR